MTDPKEYSYKGENRQNNRLLEESRVDMTTSLDWAMEGREEESGESQESRK